MKRIVLLIAAASIKKKRVAKKDEKYVLEHN